MGPIRIEIVILVAASLATILAILDVVGIKIPTFGRHESSDSKGKSRPYAQFLLSFFVIGLCIYSMRLEANTGRSLSGVAACIIFSSGNSCKEPNESSKGLADAADNSALGGQNAVHVANRPSTFCEQINYATGNPELNAMYNAAWSLDNGTDGRVDRERARQLYRDAAQRGHRASQYNYAVMLHRGQGGPVDNPASVYWHQQAANQDDYLATISLAGAYADGWPGVGRNYAKALQYSLIAEKCEKGDMTNNIGVIYARGGWGVERDLGTARIWFRKAEVRGSRHASRNLGTIEDGLDNSEILLWDDIGPP